jgi:hypothetical protein
VGQYVAEIGGGPEGGKVAGEGGVVKFLVHS